MMGTAWASSLIIDNAIFIIVEGYPISIVLVVLLQVITCGNFSQSLHLLDSCRSHMSEIPV